MAAWGTHFVICILNNSKIRKFKLVCISLCLQWAFQQSHTFIHQSPVEYARSIFSPLLLFAIPHLPSIPSTIFTMSFLDYRSRNRKIISQQKNQQHTERARVRALRENVHSRFERKLSVRETEEEKRMVTFWYKNSFFKIILPPQFQNPKCIHDISCFLVYFESFFFVRNQKW